MRPADLEWVTIPSGMTTGEQRHRTALLRPLSGHEEELLASQAAEVSAAERVTMLLARCVERIGPADADVGTVRRLTVGDREALLLHLRRLTAGDRIDCMVTCPQAACGEPIDLELRATDLLLDPYEDAPLWREEELALGSRRARVRFRLPTGADQEAIATLARDDAALASRRLLARCVEPSGGDGDVLADLGEEGIVAVSARMSDLDPQAELRLRTRCPACDADIATLFDTAAYLFAEVEATGHRLYEEVHALAWHYHWSEGDILDLTARRRRRYLDLIASSLERAARQGAA